MSSRMTRTKSSPVMLLCLLGLSATLSRTPASVRGLGIENRQGNIIEMTADDGHHQASKGNRHPSKDVQTMGDKVKEDLKTSSESAMKYIVTKKETEELNRNSNTDPTYAHKNSQEENKDSTKPTFHSLATNIVDVFQEESRIDKLPDVYRVNFRDEFRCLPCHCYYTISQNIVASCNSSLDQVNAVLRNETQQLKISYSPIRVFNATDFLQYHILQNLTLSKNKNLSTIANSSDNYQMLTVERLDLSFSSIKDIMDRSFVKFPNLLNLNLQHNYIKIISRLTFEGVTNLKYLNLSRNPLSVLTVGSFNHLQKLEVLDMSCVSIWNLIKPGLFPNLASLHQLYINGNWRHAKSYPNEEIARLRNLTFLSIDGISEHVILGPQIKNLTKLVTLHVGFSRTRECHLRNITESFLENVPYLQTVRFSLCPLTSVDPKVYKNVKNLISLEIVSTYPYDIFKALDGLSGLQNSSLKYLRLINLIEDGCPFICLYGRHAKYLRSIDLEIIDLSDNRIGYMGEEFLNALPQTLQTLRLLRNELIEPSLLTDKLTHLEKLQTIDLGAYPDSVINHTHDEVYHTNDGEFPQKQTSSMFIERYDDSEDFRACEEMTNGGFMYKRNVQQKAPVCKELLDNEDSKHLVATTNITNPNSLQHTYRNFKSAQNKTPMLKYLLAPGFLEMNMTDLFQNIEKSGYTNMMYIDFSYCALPSLTHFTFMPPSIQVAIFNGNYFRHIHGEVFQYNNSLTHLSLNRNVLGYKFANTRELIFTNLSNLEYLDISVNMIYELPPNFFQGLNNLKYLIMADNKLGLLNTNFSTTPKLEYLDLRKNSISLISKSSRDELDIIGTNHKLYIELNENYLRCTCEGLEVLHWIRASNINFPSKDVFICLRDDGSTEDMGNIDDRVRSLQRQCAGRSLIIVLCVSSLVVICFLVVFGVMYRYRWQLRYIRNIALSRFIGYKPRDTACSEHRFDAFIVYSDMSRRFVFGDCLQELEVKRGHKLCVDDRDFMPGTHEVSAIVSAIQNSRKTVLILSPDFHDEPFSEYSVKMALMEEIYQKRSVLYLCVYRPLPDDEMSKSYDLLMIMNRNNYIEFPPETETRDEIRHNFWDRLSEKIGNSVTKELSSSTKPTDS